MSELLVPVVDASLDDGVVDARAFAQQCLDLPSVRALLRDRGRRLRVHAPDARGHWRGNVEIHLRLMLGKCRRTRGYANYGKRRVTLTIGSPIEREAVEELILHEVVHLVVDGHGGAAGVKDGDYRHHGPEFRVALLQAAFDLWPGIRGRVRNEGKCYAMDRQIWQAARDLPSG